MNPCPTQQCYYNWLPLSLPSLSSSHLPNLAQTSSKSFLVTASLTHTHTHTHTCTHRCTSPASTGLEGGCPGHLLDPGLSCSKIKICPFWCQRSAWLAFQHGSDTRGEEQGTCIDHLQPGGVNLTSHNPHKTLKSEHRSCLTPKEKPRMKRGRDKDKAAKTHTRRSFRVCPGLSLTEADTAESRQTDTQGSLASSGKVEGALWFRSRCVDEFQ